MNNDLMDILASIALQHLWQSAMLLGLTLAALKLSPLRANTRSWIWLGMMILSVLAPLAVFVPELEQAPAPVAPSVQQVLAERGGVSLDFGPAQAVSAAALAPPVPGWMREAILVLWGLGLLWHVARLAHGWQVACNLRREAMPEPALEGLVRDRLPRGTSISACDKIGSPMVVGLVHSCILLPRRFTDDLPGPVLCDILNHEIAHILRRDLWASVAQQLFIAVFWWSPALRLIAAHLDLAREMACDEDAARCSGHGKGYARSLLAAIETLAARPRHPVLASGMFGSQKDISQRIKGVLAMDTTTRKYGKKMPALLWGAVMLTAVTVTFAATPRVTDGGSVEAGAVNDLRTQRMIAAVKTGSIDAVRELMAQGYDINSGVDGDGTALIAAARSGNLEMVEALLSMNAQVDLAWPGDGNPLIAASAEGHQGVVERLLQAGANVNAICFMDETPLINAVRADRIDTVKYLVERGANVNLGAWADGKRWRTPLSQARTPAIRKFLLGQGASA